MALALKKRQTYIIHTHLNQHTYNVYSGLKWGPEVQMSVTIKTLLKPIKTQKCDQIVYLNRVLFRIVTAVGIN